MHSITRLVLTAAATCLAAVVACAGAKKLAPGQYAAANTKHTFTVHFDGGCPTDALMDPSYRNCTNGDPECVMVKKNFGHKVVVVADPGNAHDFGVDTLQTPLVATGGPRAYDIDFERGADDAGYKFGVTGTAPDGGRCDHDPTVVIGK